MKIREVASTLVRADRSTVFSCLTEDRALGPDAAVERIPDERVAFRPPDGTAHAWFQLEDAPDGGTRVVHGAVLEHADVVWSLLHKRHRKHLRRTLEDDLFRVKRIAESAGARAKLP